MMSEDDEELIKASDVEYYNLDFDIGPSDENVISRGTSELYYSVALSPDERYMAFYTFNMNTQERRLVVWEVGSDRIILDKPVWRMEKVEFMPTGNKIVTLCGKRGTPGEDITIFNLSGEVVKRIDFPYKTDTGAALYKNIYNFAVSPDSRYIALMLHSILIYDLENDEILNKISESDFGRSIDFTSYRLFWPRENGLVLTTYRPPMWYTPYDVFLEYRRYPMKYATMIDPFTKEVLHRVPIRYTSRITYGDAYFVSPDGEYFAVVTKYLYLPRFSDFDSSGKYVGDGNKWRAVKKYRTNVTHVGWSPTSKELIYDYKNGFVTYNYGTLKPTRRIVIEDIDWMRTWRIFWLRDNRIYFVLDNFPTVVGMLSL